MRTYWSQAAMLLLGITLTVGFYEGRRLVKNTYRAVTAATAMSAPGGKTRRDRDDDDRDAIAADDEPHERKRRRSRSPATGIPRSGLAPGIDGMRIEANLRPTTMQRTELQKADGVRTRGKPLPSGRMAVGPLGIPSHGPVVEREKPEPVLDTAVETEK